MTTTPELRQIMVFIWTKILALDKSCQVDLVKDGGHTYFIRFLDSLEAFPEQRAMTAFVLAVIVDGHRRGQEACIEANLIHVCLKHLQSSTPNDGQTEPLFLQWLCLCLGKLWEDYIDAQIIGLQADAPAVFSSLLAEPQPEVRASAIFALGTLLDVGSDSAETSIVGSLLSVVSDGSPLVRAEVAVALARFAFGHNKHLKSIAAAYWKPHCNSLLSSLPSLAHIRSSGTAYTNSNQHMPHGSIVSSQIGPLLRFGNENSTLVRDGRVSTSSPLANTGMMHGSPLSDDSSQHSDSGVLHEDADYTLKGKQKLVTAFSAIQGHKPGVRSINAVVDWQQQSGYLYASGEISSIMLWDLDKEQLVKSIPSSSDCSISALIVSASQAGDIQFLDIRNQRDRYLTIDAHRGSLTALAVHRHAPILASGSAKQLIKVFSLDGDQLGTIRYHQQACFHCWWNQT
ncbi:transducin family protein [Cucumis melo var. makuwa]|uniref:Transducin family protein n=1 Tax=Cucumis melo var. makuwa TaxID=1194695 RepID=A0A5A7UI95_CUCMM|nr:transducin family protein [Cucumis melo var. makuwa]